MSNIEKETHTVEKPQSGWESPENVEKIINSAPALLAAYLASKEKEVNSSKVIRICTLSVIGSVVLGAIGCYAYALFLGNFDLAEKIIIPLLSFAGGLGAASGLRS
jgi:hypothetical protein